MHSGILFAEESNKQRSVFVSQVATETNTDFSAVINDIKNNVSKMFFNDARMKAVEPQ